MKSCTFCTFVFLQDDVFFHLYKGQRTIALKCQPNVSISSGTDYSDQYQIYGGSSDGMWAPDVTTRVRKGLAEDEEKFRPSFSSAMSTFGPVTFRQQTLLNRQFWHSHGIG